MQPQAEAVTRESSEPALSRDERQRVQQQLTVLGFYDRGIDGSFGPGTRAAIRRFQAAHGLEATGYLDPQALAALSDAELALLGITLKWTTSLLFDLGLYFIVVGVIMAALSRMGRGLSESGDGAASPHGAGVTGGTAAWESKEPGGGTEERTGSETYRNGGA